jgi:hypothetical protein
MQEIDKILDIANAEVGYLEKSKDAYRKDPTVLYDKTRGAGSDNYTKYAKEMDSLKVYNGQKQGYAWCNVFIDWLFYKALGIDRARELLIGFNAGCTQDWNWFKSHGQIVNNPQRGDLIFFKNLSHIGIIEKVENGKVYTIEGNTSNKAELIVNGGTVAKKVYNIGSSYIYGYARPRYRKSELTIKVHVADKGWLEEVGLGEIAGTTGENRQMEAIILNSNTISLEYRVHVAEKGWLPWVHNGQVAGTTGENRRIEAMEIKSSKQLRVQEHIQDVGWMPPSKGMEIHIGTQGKCLQMEAIKIELL